MDTAKRINDKVRGSFERNRALVVGELEKFRDSVDSKISADRATKFAQMLINILNDQTICEVVPDDLAKRQRVKADELPDDQRCCANRANGERCTRRTRNGAQYCGTHAKNRPTPLNLIDAQPAPPPPTDATIEPPKPLFQRVTLTSRRVSGVLYYADDCGNAYSTIEVLNNNINPRIIGRIHTNDDGTLSLITAAES